MAKADTAPAQYRYQQPLTPGMPARGFVPPERLAVDESGDFYSDGFVMIRGEPTGEVADFADEFVTIDMARLRGEAEVDAQPARAIGEVEAGGVAIDYVVFLLGGGGDDDGDGEIVAYVDKAKLDYATSFWPDASLAFEMRAPDQPLVVLETKPDADEQRIVALIMPALMELTPDGKAILEDLVRRARAAAQ